MDVPFDVPRGTVFIPRHAHQHHYETETHDPE
jgi:hypothetical protein